MNHVDQLYQKVREEQDLDRIVSGWLSAFEAALASGEESAVAALLTDDGNWRDVLAFTWHLLPRVGAQTIAAGFVERQPAVQARDFEINPNRTPPRRVKRLGRDCIEAIYRFRTRVGRGAGALRLTASDGALAASDDVVITVNPAPPVNQPPTVNAGADQSITLPAAANLTGSASDDGLPTPANLVATWSAVSGPGAVTFGSANALNRRGVRTSSAALRSRCARSCWVWNESRQRAHA